MWANPWGAWPLQQSAYANMPSEQIDWAELAKQWIAQKEAMSSGTGDDATQPPPPPPPQQQQQQTIPPLQPISQNQPHSVPPPPPPYPPLPSEVKPSNVGTGASEGGRELDNAAGANTGSTGPPQPMLLEQIPHPLQPLHSQVSGETQNEMEISDGENEGGNRESSYKNLAPLPNQPMPSNLPLMNQLPPPPPPAAAATQPMPGDWNWNMGNWNVPPHQAGRPPPPPPPAWNMQHHQVSEHQEDQSYDYGNNFHQNFDYNHGNDQFRYQQNEDSWRHESNQNRNFRSNRGNRSRSPAKSHMTTNPVDDTGIDATKRKNLPAWIREGLEKMEREKQKKLEKERKDKEQMEALKAQEDVEQENVEAVLKESTQEKRDNDKEVFPSKSRFESDEEGAAKSDHEPTFSKSEKSSPSPDDFKTDEEKQAELQMKVRRYLTEILLEVTNTEIESISREVYFKARNRAAKAPAKQLAKSTALASLSTLGVGSDSASDDDDKNEGINKKLRKHTDNDSDEESDNALHERIRQRQLSRQQRRNFSSSESDSERDPNRSVSREKASASLNDISAEKFSFGRKSDKTPGLDVKSDHQQHKVKIQDDEIKDKCQTDSSGGDSHLQTTKEMSTIVKNKKSKKKSSSSSSSSSSSRSSSSSSSSSSSTEGGAYSDSDSSDSSSDSSSSDDSSSSASLSSSDKKQKLLKAIHDGKIHGEILHAYLKKRERGEQRSGQEDSDKYRRSGSRDSYERQHSRSGLDRYSNSDRYRDSYESSNRRHKTNKYEEKYDRYKYGSTRNGTKSSKGNYEPNRESMYGREGSYSSIGSTTTSKNRRSKQRKSRSNSSDSDHHSSSSKRRKTEKYNTDRWYEERSERYKQSRERSDYERSGGKRSSRKHKSRSASRSRYR